jgi:DNA end-binding protein Ku
MELLTNAGADMALRSIWKGNIRFSLVSVPVEAFTAAEPEEEIRLNQLHDECHSRIRYKKTCPIHGEVSNDEIVTGFEYDKDKYVVVDRNEVEQAQTKGDKSINIETFITPDDIDPIYYDGQTYYLVPAKGGAEKPYAVLREAMKKSKHWGMATVVLHARQHVVVVRPVESLMTMTMLHYKSEIRSPDVLKDEVPQAKVNAQELKLAQQLIEASTDKKFDLGKFQDHYTEQLRELIESKVEGKEIVVPEQTEEEIPVINLMDALKKSVQKSKSSKKAYRHIPRTRKRKSS